MQLNKKRKIKFVRCTCVVEALGKCKHVYALIHFVNSDRSTSRTSLEQNWGKFPLVQMGKEKYSKGKSVSELFPSKAAYKITTEIVPRLFLPKDFDGINCAARNITIAENMSAQEREKKKILTQLANENAKKIGKHA